MIDYGFGVKLGPLKQENLEFYRLERNDMQCMRWCRQYKLIDEMDQAQWYHEQREDPSILMFEIIDNASNPVGVCGLTDINHLHQRAEFSCWIAQHVRLKGLCRKALKTLFKYGFDELHLHQIWGETFQDNPASDLFVSLGMKLDGVRRDFYFKNGRWIDCKLYSLKSYEILY